MSGSFYSPDIVTCSPWICRRAPKTIPFRQIGSRCRTARKVFSVRLAPCQLWVNLRNG